MTIENREVPLFEQEYAREHRSGQPPDPWPFTTGYAAIVLLVHALRPAPDDDWILLYPAHRVGRGGLHRGVY